METIRTFSNTQSRGRRSAEGARSSPIAVRLVPTLRRKVERIAREDRRSLAAVIEIAVIKFLEERTE